MKERTNLKLVNQHTKEVEKRSEQTRRLSLTEGERRIVLDNLLDRLDQANFEASVQFCSGLAETSGVWSHEPEAAEFIDLLCPWIKPREGQVSAALVSIADLGDPATQDLDQEFYFLKCHRQEIGLQIGILMGARLAGCSPEKINKMAQYLVETLY